MPPFSSSTSSSELTSPAAQRGGSLRVRGRVRRVLVTIGWTLLVLVLMDIGINIAFPYPRSNAARPNALQIYFDYGRSVESKLDRMLAEGDADADPVALAGWLDPMVRDVTPKPRRVGATFFGMSFSNEIAEAARKMDPHFAPTTFAGPAAPPNHSYACFLAERGRDPSPVQVWAILASSVRGMFTLTGMTTTFERPSPFTYPRYKLDEKRQLYDVQPLLRTPGDMRAARRDPAKWQAFLDQLAEHDRFYDARQMGASAVVDASASLRLLRRAYAQRVNRARRDEVLTEAGFAHDPELGPVLAAMVSDFDQRCRAEGKLPIVLLIQDRGSADALFRLVGPVLQEARIPFVSTHEIIDATDPLNFISDGHFVPEANEKIARRLLEVIRAELGSRAAVPAASSLP